MMVYLCLDFSWGNMNKQVAFVYYDHSKSFINQNMEKQTTQDFYEGALLPQMLLILNKRFK